MQNSFPLGPDYTTDRIGKHRKSNDNFLRPRFLRLTTLSLRLSLRGRYSAN
jgi:hypothetical protein